MRPGLLALLIAYSTASCRDLAPRATSDQRPTEASAPPSAHSPAVAASAATAGSRPATNTSTTAVSVATATAPVTATVPYPRTSDFPADSPLVVHSASGRIYASQADARGAVRLLTYAASDGRLVGTEPLFPGEVLLDVDDAGRRYLMESNPSVRVMPAGTNAASAEALRLPIPTPDWADPAFPGQASMPLQPAWPIVDRARGHVLAFSGAHVTVVDAASGAVTRRFEVPPAGTRGSIVRAALDAAGDTLYVAVAEPAREWSSPEARMIALGYRTLQISDESDLFAGFEELVETWLPTGNGVIVSVLAWKLLGSDQRVWEKGREVARLTEAMEVWTAYDTKRSRAIGEGFVGDGRTLEFEFEIERVGQALTAYDPVTDQFFGRSGDDARLIAVGADSLTRVSAARSIAVNAAIHPGSSDQRGGSVIAGTGHLGIPVFLTGSYRPTAFPGEPTPEPWYLGQVVSRDGGISWEELPGSWTGCLVASDGFERHQTLFGCFGGYGMGGYGVFRSEDAGRSWSPASGGLGTLAVREIALSPTYAADGTLFAEAETSYAELGEGVRPTMWRSRDRGATWRPVGAFAAIAVSPSFDEDRRVIGFDAGSRYHESADAGETWEPRGRLPDLVDESFWPGRSWIIPAAGGEPEVVLVLATSGVDEMGGGQHWPSSGARLFRSTDGGVTWDVAWGTRDDWGLDAVLLGPYVRVSQSSSGASLTHQVWMLGVEGGPQGTLMSEDGGAHWRQVHLPADPHARLLAMLPNGEVMIGGAEPGYRMVRVEDFVLGPPP